ncbi:MAG: sterol-binding protein [Steroidobacteraceae bacterium]|jgi:ubiquinone biosynthesis protein UbiJ
MPATPAWIAALESILNRSIDRSQKAQGLAQRLNRTSLEVHVEGVARIRAAVCVDRVGLSTGGDIDADALISGSPIALFKLIREGAGTSGPTADRSRAAARVAGDAEIAARYRELFALARPDLEEELSRLIGDLPARRLSLAAQGAIGWARRAGRTARENLAEYLQEESRDLVARPEVEEFVHGVDRLRDTAERVEARLARLEQRLREPR